MKTIVPRETKDIRLEIKARNNLVLKRVESAGFKSLKQFCETHGLSYSEVAAIVAMTKSPLSVRTRNRRWRGRAVETLFFRPVVEKLAKALGCSPWDLFTEQTMRDIPVEPIVLEIDSSMAAQMRTLVAPGVETTDALAIRSFTSEEIRRVLKTLTPREEECLCELYGLFGREESTVDEVAERHGVGAAAVAYVHNKALRKLQHPSRRARLAAVWQVPADEVISQ